MADTVVTGDIRLPATILMPADARDVPIVVMVHGSGALDRDETIYQNKPFRDIAEGLTRKGIATLRYDKRTYIYRQPVTTMDDETMLDALSAIRLAHQYSSRVYLLGHSLGAMLAPLIAERTAEPLAGVIMLAAPARDMETVVREQFDYLLPSGASPAFKEQQIENLRQRSPHYLQPQGQTDAAHRLTIPMLILQGERDYQVTMQDFRLWQQVLNGKSNIIFHSYPRLNHLFMDGEDKSNPMEYQKLGHVTTYVIDDISSFIHHYDTIRKDSCQQQHRLSFVRKGKRPIWSISPNAVKMQKFDPYRKKFTDMRIMETIGSHVSR